MKLYKRMAALFLSVAAVFLLIPAAASAAETIDLSRDVRLTISYQDGDVPIVGAEFSIYLVADVDENGELTTTPAFRQFNVDIRGRTTRCGKPLPEPWRAMSCGIRSSLRTAARRVRPDSCISPRATRS